MHINKHDKYSKKMDTNFLHYRHKRTPNIHTPRTFYVTLPIPFNMLRIPCVVDKFTVCPKRKCTHTRRNAMIDVGRECTFCCRVYSIYLFLN